MKTTQLLTISIVTLLILSGCSSAPNTTLETEVTETPLPNSLETESGVAPTVEFGVPSELDNGLELKVNLPIPVEVEAVNIEELQNPHMFEVTITNNSLKDYAEKADFTLMSGNSDMPRVTVTENSGIANQPSVIPKGETATFGVVFDMSNTNEYLLTVWTTWDHVPVVLKSVPLPAE